METATIAFQIFGGIFFWCCVFQKPLKRLDEKVLATMERIEDQISCLSTKTITITYLSGMAAFSLGGEMILLAFHAFWMIGIFLFPRALISKPSKKFLKGIPETMYIIFFAPLLWLGLLDW